MDVGRWPGSSTRTSFNTPLVLFPLNNRGREVTKKDCWRDFFLKKILELPRDNPYYIVGKCGDQIKTSSNRDENFSTRKISRYRGGGRKEDLTTEESKVQGPTYVKHTKQIYIYVCPTLGWKNQKTPSNGSRKIE